MYKPDYKVERCNAGFNWYVNSTYGPLLDITGITLKEFNLNPAAGIELYKKENHQKIVEIFGEDVGLPSVGTPSISYGHINGLGHKLVFPEKGEVNYAHNEKSLDEYIEMLKKDIDFSKQEDAPFYIDYKNKLQEAYPDERIEFRYSYEGPLTTAYELRGTNAFYDPYDDPDNFKEFLKVLTNSIIEFIRFMRRTNGNSEFDMSTFKIYDDIAAMFSPSMWEEFVFPYWEQIYCAFNSGKRMLHCEDLSPAHMYLLEKIGLVNYDPGISHKLNPEIIRDGTRVPFGWRMGSFHFFDLTVDEVRDWVFKAVSDGASYVFAYIETRMTDEPTVKKVKAFIEASKYAKKMLAEGASRQQIGQCVSENGKIKFWAHWPK